MPPASTSSPSRATTPRPDSITSARSHPHHTTTDELDGIPGNSHGARPFPLSQGAECPLEPVMHFERSDRCYAVSGATCTLLGGWYGLKDVKPAVGDVEPRPS